MKVGDLVQLRVIEYNDAGEIFNVRHKGLIVSGAYDHGWVEVLFFDGDQMYYNAKDYEWNKKFWKVLNENE